METKLEKMTAAEYDEFYKWSFDNHVKDLVKSTNVSVEQAVNETERELHDMLPNGIDTEDNLLMAIVDSSEQKRVGFIWYLYEETNGIHQCFLCDFIIYEPERRKGYASKALNLMEKNAVESGCQESVLLVEKENEAAKKLYAKQGYVFLRAVEEGMYLKKELSFLSSF